MVSRLGVPLLHISTVLLKHMSRCCDKYSKDQVKNIFLSNKASADVLYKLGLNTSAGLACLHMILSTLCSTLLHCYIN